MDCPKCQTANPEGKKFCRKCGAKLLLACPECGTEILPDDDFCGECGHNLALPIEPTPKDLSFDEKIDKIQRYLPKGLTEKILSKKAKIEGERKQVTVMFCDMEGFTPLVENLGPEEAYTIMDQVYEILIHKVHDYEGTVNEMTGDGIMALFGAPIALEDAPQRAIRSAYSIHREMAKFNDKITQEREGILLVKMRIGIHSGPVVVGTLGNDLRLEFKAVGDTVNLASRMEGLAEPGATYVTENTFKLTEGFFRFEALGAKEVKGKKESTNVYRVIAPSSRRTKFDVSAERGLTPFVGRGRELELLLAGFEWAKSGRGQAFSIVSDAGMGKSRLLYEFRKSVANEDATFLEGKCLSYSSGVAYHPVIDILKSNFDIREEDKDSEIKKKVKRGLEILGADEASTLPYLLEVLSVKDIGIPALMMSPEGKRDRIIESLNRIALKGSEIRPLIMAIEDLHWIDRSSEEVLRNLLDSIPGIRLFLILTYRPVFVPPWGAKSYHNQLTLNRLSNLESLSIVNHLLGTKELDRNLEELILEKTEGVPFFIEEFVRSLKELEVIEKEDGRYRLVKDTQDATIPSTIQDIIMARVDTLPEGAKEVLQSGSVIEREFSYELIKRVTGLQDQEMLTNLSALKDLELLYERGVHPQSTYVFKHALTQEVVYNSILVQRRKEIHEEAGSAIEDFNKDSIEEYYGVLANHYIQSENYDKGSEYSKLAARKAQKAGSLSDAITYSKSRVACLEKLPGTEDVEKKTIDARTTLGLQYSQTNDFVSSKEAVEPIVELALKRNYKRRIAHIYIIMGAYAYAVEENFPKAERYLADAIKFAADSNDFISLVMANHHMGHLLADDCEFEKALQHLEKALDITVAANVTWGIATHKSCISRTIFSFKGEVERGYQGCLEGLKLAEQSGDAYSKMEAYVSLGYSCYAKGFFDQAMEHLPKGRNFCERLSHITMHCLISFCLGETYFYRQEYQQAKDYYTEAIWYLENNGLFPSTVDFFKMALARAIVYNKERNIDLGALQSRAKEIKVKIFDCRVKRYMADLLLNFGEAQIDEAEEWAKEAIEADIRNGMTWELGRAHALHAKIFKRKGDELEAKEKLTKAIDILKECGADGWVKIYKEELASIS